MWIFWPLAYTLRKIEEDYYLRCGPDLTGVIVELKWTLANIKVSNQKIIMERLVITIVLALYGIGYMLYYMYVKK